MAHQVFISYSTRDKEVAAEACAALEERDVDCWIAPRNISGGSDWGEAIVHAIKQARILLLVFSEHANRSEQVKREIALAVGNGLFILPFRIEDVEPRSSLQYFLSTSHWLDALERPVEPMMLHMAKTVQRALAEPDAERPSMGELTRMSFAVSDLPDAESEIRAAARADADKPKRGRGVLKETVASAAVKLHEGDEMEGRTGRDQTRLAAPAATMVAPAAGTKKAPSKKPQPGKKSSDEKVRSSRGRTMTMILPVWQERFWFSKLAVILLLVVIVVLIVTRTGGDDDQEGLVTDVSATDQDRTIPLSGNDDDTASDASGTLDDDPYTPISDTQDIDDVIADDDGEGGEFLLPIEPTDPPPSDYEDAIEFEDTVTPPGDVIYNEGGESTDRNDDVAVVTEDPVRVRARIERLLLQAQEDLQSQRYVSPAGGNALDRFREILRLDPGNVNAKVGIRRIARAYIALANDAMDKGHFSRAGSYLEIAADTDPESPDVSQAYRRLSDLRSQQSN